MDGPNNGIILYHYSYSPYARRIVWYLNLRGIDFAQVIQPPVMPRPDLQTLGVSYRRIPVMAIGKDVYCDTRLILAKLEKLFPGSGLTSQNHDEAAIQKLLEVWTVESGVFVRASQLIPSSMPLMNDPKFVKDREEFSGRPWTKELIDKNRPEALASIRSSFDFLETTLLADGRDWVAKTSQPSLADIQAIWPFDWLKGLKGALPEGLISEETYPRVFAWIKRFNQAVQKAKVNSPKPSTLKGDVAAKRIRDSDFAEEEGQVDASDPLQLKKGDQVEVFPVDSGFAHRDRGAVVSLAPEEVVIALASGLRLHAPRTGFRISKVGVGAKL